LSIYIEAKKKVPLRTMIELFIKYYLGDKMKVAEVGGECRLHGALQEMYTKFSLGNLNL
jgi:hypothetical protein